MISFARPVSRNGKHTVSGPKWTKLDLFRPEWNILVHLRLANAKIQLGGKGHFDILVQHAFQQYCSHSLCLPLPPPTHSAVRPMVLTTELTKALGIKHPIIQGGMHYVGYAELAAAVSNAGGLGIITALTVAQPPKVGSLISEVVCEFGILVAENACE